MFVAAVESLLCTEKRLDNISLQPKYSTWLKRFPPAKTISNMLNTLLYTPRLLPESSLTGIILSIFSLKLIVFKNSANKQNPPYAVIFFLRKFNRYIVDSNACVIQYFCSPFLVNISLAEFTNITAIGELFLRLFFV